MTGTIVLSSLVRFAEHQCLLAASQGLPASSFGNLIFVDYTEINYGMHSYLVLLAIDGATNLLWATALTSLDAPETLSAFRLWIDKNNCVPKKKEEIRPSSRILSWTSIASMAFHRIPADQGPLGPTGQSDCLNVLGLTWLRLLLRKATS